MIMSTCQQQPPPPKEFFTMLQLQSRYRISLYDLLNHYKTHRGAEQDAAEAAEWHAEEVELSHPFSIEHKL
jgi:hypothetical protein